MELDGRTQQSANYRYSFQGQEADDEIKGNGNSVNYKYRMHDPRVGRFFAVDPLAPKYPWYTPYQFSGNKVIHMIELEGLEEVDVYTQWRDDQGTLHKKYSHTYIDNNLKENINRYDTYNSKGKVHYREFYGQTTGRSYVAPTGSIDSYRLLSTFNGEEVSGSYSVNTQEHGFDWVTSISDLWHGDLVSTRCFARLQRKILDFTSTRSGIKPLIV